MGKHTDQIQTQAADLRTANNAYLNSVRTLLNYGVLPSTGPGGHLHVEPREGDDLTKAKTNGAFMVLQGDYADFINALKSCVDAVETATADYGNKLADKRSSPKNKIAAEETLKKANDDAQSMLDSLASSPAPGRRDVNIVAGEPPRILSERWQSLLIHYESGGKEKKISLAVKPYHWPSPDFDKMMHDTIGRQEIKDRFAKVLEKGRALMPEKAGAKTA